MPTKKISLIYEGEAELIDAAIEILSQKGGYRELTQAQIDAGQIQKSKEDVAKAFVTNFIRGVVKSHNAQMARAQAEAQSESTLNLISVSLVQE